MCNCDYDYCCSEECRKKVEEDGLIHFLDYIHYAGKNEDGETIDVRDQ